MLFEHDVEVLGVCTRRARLNQLEQHICAGERPKPADHTKHSLAW